MLDLWEILLQHLSERVNQRDFSPSVWSDHIATLGSSVTEAVTQKNLPSRDKTQILYSTMRSRPSKLTYPFGIAYDIA